MPKASKSKSADSNRLPSSTFVLDNGGYSIKAGFASAAYTNNADALSRCYNVPNAIARTRDNRIHIAAQLDERVTQWNEATFRRPIERGQLINWESQKEIWDYTFFDEKTAKRDLLVKQPEETTLVLTEAPNTLPFLQKCTDEIVMEEWGFGGYARVVGPSLSAYNELHNLFGDPTPPSPASNPTQPIECLLIVDAGFSHTTIIPLYNGEPIQRAIRRFDFGGKHLTNLLKEVISLRYYDLHQDVKIVNDIKEDICFVSKDFATDMEKCWKGNLGRRKPPAQRPQPTTPPPEPDHDDMAVDPSTPELNDLHPDPKSPAPAPSSSEDLRIDYILPDGRSILRGFSRLHNPLAFRARKRKHSPTPASSLPSSADEVSMTLSDPRFTVPELIFSPSLYASQLPGLPDTIMQSLAVLPPLLQAGMLSHILLVGGTAKLPGFVGRLEDEVRQRVPGEWPVRVRCLEKEGPERSSWLGGARGKDEVVRRVGVSRVEYLEKGAGWLARKFAGKEG